MSLIAIAEGWTIAEEIALAVAAAANAAAIGLTMLYEDLHPGKKPDTAPSPAPQGGDNKTPDPVVTDGGHDYAGVARPYHGPVGLTANFGVGHTLCTVPLAMDLKRQRDAVAKEVQKIVKRQRRRPQHDTRSWTAVKRKLEDRFNAAAGEVRDIAQEFHRDWERHRHAARIAGRLVNAIEGGNLHIEL